MLFHLHTHKYKIMRTQITKYFILIFIWGFLCSGLCLVAALFISSISKEDNAVMYRWELARNSGTRPKNSLTSTCVQSREIELNVMRLEWRRKMQVSNELYSTCYVRLESVQYFTFVNRRLVERIAARLISAYMNLGYVLQQHQALSVSWMSRAEIYLNNNLKDSYKLFFSKFVLLWKCFSIKTYYKKEVKKQMDN